MPEELENEELEQDLPIEDDIPEDEDVLNDEDTEEEDEEVKEEVLDKAPKPEGSADLPPAIPKFNNIEINGKQVYPALPVAALPPEAAVIATELGARFIKLSPIVRDGSGGIADLTQFKMSAEGVLKEIFEQGKDKLKTDLRPIVEDVDNLVTNVIPMIAKIYHKQIIKPALRANRNPKAIAAAEVRMKRMLTSAQVALMNNLHAAQIHISDDGKAALRQTATAAVKLLAKLATTFVSNLGAGVILK